MFSSGSDTLGHKIDDIPELAKANNFQAIGILLREKLDEITEKKVILRFLLQLAVELIESGNSDAFKILLEGGLGANWGHKKKCLLYYAILSGNLTMVKLLVDHGAKIKEKIDPKEDDVQEQPLILAVRKGCHDILTYLLDKGASPGYPYFEVSRDKYHVIDPEHASLLSLAIIKGDMQSLSILLAHAKSELIESTINRVYYRKKFYSQEDSQNIARILLDHSVGMDFYSLEFVGIFDSLKDINFRGVSVKGKPVTRRDLELAAKGKLDIDKAIIASDDLDQLQDPARKDTINQQLAKKTQSRGFLEKDGVINLVSLSCALEAEEKDEEAIRVRLVHMKHPNKMVDKSKDVYSRKVKTYAIERAARHKLYRIVLLMCDHPKFDTNTLGPVIEHVKYKQHEFVLAKKLAERVGVNQVDCDGLSLLHRAVLQADLGGVRDLIRKGADVRLSSTRGTPLTIATRGPAYNSCESDRKKYDAIRFDMVKTLISAGADPNEVDYDGHTSMHSAAIMGWLAVFEYLLPLTNKNPVAKESRRARRNVVIEFLPWYEDILFTNSSDAHIYLAILKILEKERIDFNIVSKKHGNLLHFVMGEMNSHINHYLNRRMSHELASLYSDILEILELLLKNGISPNVVDANENTPLHAMLTNKEWFKCYDSVPNGIAKIIAVFNRYGFDASAKNKVNLTVSDLLLKNGKKLSTETPASKNNIPLAKEVVIDIKNPALIKLHHAMNECEVQLPSDREAINKFFKILDSLISGDSFESYKVTHLNEYLLFGFSDAELKSSLRKLTEKDYRALANIHKQYKTQNANQLKPARCIVFFEDWPEQLDDHIKQCCQHMYQAVDELQLWRAFETEPRTNTFQFACGVNYGVRKVEEHDLVQIDGHSGASFAVTARHIQYIAVNGWDAYLEFWAKKKNTPDEEPVESVACQELSSPRLAF